MKKLWIIPLLALLSCNNNSKQSSSYIDLSGPWQFALDSQGSGEEGQWYLQDLDDRVDLPGTTDSNRKGRLNTDTTTMHLNRVYTYAGIAWYRKEVVIPESFRGKYISLELERTRPTRIWIDSSFVGGSMLLQSPQVFDVSGHLSPGRHFISIRVNNDLALTPYGNVHQYSDDTQTNWNGIIGTLGIRARPRTHISRLRVFPDVSGREVEIRMELASAAGKEAAPGKLHISYIITKMESGKAILQEELDTIAGPGSGINVTFPLGDACELWDEYEQPLYRLHASVSSGGETDTKSVSFGMREMTVQGKHLAINGRPVFLRGKQEAAVFPITGHTPMETGEWMRVFKVAKSYGINHYRFHSYCPPEAAFEAADRLGIYLQPELPFWGGLDSDTVALRLREEGLALLDAYANHPSFVLFSHGNEIWGGHDRVEENILALKAHDERPLYTMGSNNNIGYVPPRPCSDFFVGARTPSDGDTTLTHLRLTHAFADSREGAILNTRIPSTDVNFDLAVSRVDIPVISHEIGQYQIYPDYSEIDKYTGVLEARNLEVFRDRLEKAGMLHMDSLFQKASGAWSALCYKAEMEAALRTADLGGFQLLDLQDFPGQGTALVGILDAFMDSKEVVTRESWKQSCNDVVLLPGFSKYCWTSGEDFEAEIKIANYSREKIDGEVTWQISGDNGELIAEGVSQAVSAPCGSLVSAEHIQVSLAGVKGAQQLTLNCHLSGTDYQSSHEIWVYPAGNGINVPETVLVTESINRENLQYLEDGGNLLYFPGGTPVDGETIPGLFPPDFWNYGMFRGISERNGKPLSPGTLGLLIEPGHPALKGFPTEFHTNWQWFSIVKKSHAAILDETGPGYRPIIQVIDNLERNHKLGMIMEFRAGKGKLLVCTAPLPEMTGLPEARQLFRSLLDYMGSPDFDPDYETDAAKIEAMFPGN